MWHRPPLAHPKTLAKNDGGLAEFRRGAGRRGSPGPQTSGFRLQRHERGCAIHKELPRALDRLDVVHAAAIPLRAEPAATRCGEMVE
jgi:hypothetical protein